MTNSYWPEGMDWRDYADECEACGAPADHEPFREGCSEEPAEGSMLLTRVTACNVRDVLRAVSNVTPQDLYGDDPTEPEMARFYAIPQIVRALDLLLAATPGQSFRLVGSDLAGQFVRAERPPAWRDSLLGVDPVGAA